MYPTASLFLLQSLKGSMSGDARDLNNIETRAVIRFVFPARQDAGGNSRHSDRNIRGTCTIVYHRQKLGGPNESRLQSFLIRHTVQPFTQSDDTRCCDNTICPPEDGHVDARNMSRTVM